MYKRGQILISVVGAIIVLLAILASGYFIFKKSNNNTETAINSSVRFIDNKDGSITDLESKLVWLKCDYGKTGEDCSGGYPNVNVPLGLVANNSPIGGGSSCHGTESAEAYCNNGVLCEDGSFEVVDWKNDFSQNKSEYPSGTTNIQSCYVHVPDSAKVRACANHGGVSKNTWRVPTLEEIKTLFEQNKEPNHLDTTFFPNSVGLYITSSAILPATNPPTVKTFFFNNNQEGSTGTGAPLKCVNEAMNVEVKSSDHSIFCKIKLPIKLTWEELDAGYKRPIQFFYKEDAEKIYSKQLGRFYADDNYDYVLSIYNKKTDSTDTYEYFSTLRQGDYCTYTSKANTHTIQLSTDNIGLPLFGLSGEDIYPSTGYEIFDREATSPKWYTELWGRGFYTFPGTEYGIKKSQNGYECYSKSESDYFCVIKNYCFNMYQENSYSGISKDFSDDVFTPPTSCQ